MDKFVLLILDAFRNFEAAGKMPVNAGQAAATFADGYGLDPLSFAMYGTILQREGFIVLDKDTGLISFTDKGREAAVKAARILDDLEHQARLDEQDPTLN